MTINIPLHIHVNIHSLHFEAPGSKKLGPEYKLSNPKEQQGFKEKKKVKNPQTLPQIT